MPVDADILSAAHQLNTLREQVTSLTAENAALRKEIDEARSRKAEREFQIATDGRAAAHVRAPDEPDTE